MNPFVSVLSYYLCAPKTRFYGYRMKDEGRNIFSVFDELLSRTDKEKMLRQHGAVIWLTGLSGSGKTTIAKSLEQQLHQKGFLTQVLDGDNIRAGINNNLTFTAEDRNENIRRISEVSKLFLNCGIVTINCFVSPSIAMRQMAREIVGQNDFIEVFVNTSLEECERRDTKGLYAKARKGEIKNFTGIDAPFEAPENAEVVLTTEGKTPQECAAELLAFILPKIQP